MKSFIRDGKLIVPWKLDNGRVIELLTPEELSKLTDGTEVISISGKRKIIGKDYIDDDTRGGRTAWGIYQNYGYYPLI